MYQAAQNTANTLQCVANTSELQQDSRSGATKHARDWHSYATAHWQLYHQDATLSHFPAHRANYPTWIDLPATKA